MIRSTPSALWWPRDVRSRRRRNRSPHLSVLRRRVVLHCRSGLVRRHGRRRRSGARVARDSRQAVRAVPDARRQGMAQRARGADWRPGATRTSRSSACAASRPPPRSRPRSSVVWRGSRSSIGRGRARARRRRPRVQAITEGLILAAFSGDRYKSQDRAASAARADAGRSWSAVGAAQQRRSRRAVERGRVLGESSNLARDLCNEPANVLTPSVFADRGAAICAATPGSRSRSSTRTRSPGCTWACCSASRAAAPSRRACS